MPSSHFSCQLSSRDLAPSAISVLRCGADLGTFEDLRSLRWRDDDERGRVMALSKRVLVPDEKGRGFARAVEAGPFILVAGMTGQWDLETWQPLPGIAGDIERQTEQIFGWLKKVLDQVGADFHHVVKANVYLKRIEDLPRVGSVRRKYLPDAGFVGTAIAISGVIGDADLEMEFELLNPRWPSAS
jgi:enamine deaminase RidA (YjgF/YER057c/UK114 family)